MATRVMLPCRVLRSVTQVSTRSACSFFRLGPGCPRSTFASASTSAPRRPAMEPAGATPTPTTPDVFMESPDQDPEITAFQAHQATAARPTAAEEARTVLALAKHGVLATISSQPESAGFPSGSFVEFADDGTGRPFFATSGLSAHTGDMSKDPRISLTVMAPSFTSLQDGRLGLQGSVQPVADADKAALREIFLKKYPNAFYVDFGDFRWFRLEQLVAVRYNGGFGMARKMSVEEYLAARPDPVAAFGGPVCGHMNADHQADTLAMIKGATGLTADSVTLLALDRLGMDANVVRKGQTFKLRLPFSRPAEDRKSVKDVIVEMTKAAAKAAKA